MIKQGLNIKLGQSMSMTPQLQQAIRLLQLSSVELQQEIQEVLETNPLLERVEEYSDSDNTTEPKETQESKSTDSPSSTTDTIPEEMNIDANWDDIYDPAWKISNNSDKSTSDFIETMHSEAQGLHQHLDWQIQMSNLSVQDKVIAELIIDYIDDDGFLTESLELIFETLSKNLLIELDEVEAVLNYIQHLGPIGVGARNLGECLLIQLQQQYKDHSLYKKTSRLLEKHLDLIEKKDYTVIKRTLRITSTDLEDIMKLIRSLDPKPGKVFNTTDTDYITPDIYVKQIPDKITNNTNSQQKQWKVSLNSETQPSLQINEYYANMLTPVSSTHSAKKDTTTSVVDSNATVAAKKEESAYIKENLQQARWFIKSVENRNSTIVNVAQAIIERQSAFFQYGDEAMKPMVLKDLADQLGLHESTISRVTTRKYMHTPRGVYEFKYFFSSHVGTETGGECSATAIRAMIKKLIAEEHPDKPLSDNKLTNLLKERGINVARRTVAKYREALAIPSSHDRKVFA